MIIHAPLWVVATAVLLVLAGFLGVGVEIMDAKRRISHLENQLHRLTRGW